MKNLQNQCQITLQKAQKADIADILQISAECNLAGWSADAYGEEIGRDNSYIQIAKDQDGTSLGFIVARFILANYSEADLINIGVRKKDQKRGIGTMLLESLCRQAASLDVKNVWLEVRKSNLNAHAFYGRNGFVKTQERKMFYTNPTEDAFVMRRKLA